MVRGHWANLASMPGLHPYSFSKDILGFLMTTESQDLSLTSHSKDGLLCQVGSGSQNPQKLVLHHCILIDETCR